MALYGYPLVPEAKNLQPAMRWVTRGIYVKTIAPWRPVSYGGTFEAKPTVVMTVPAARTAIGAAFPARGACSCAETRADSGARAWIR